MNQKDVEFTKKVLEKIPDIREEKVNNIKEQIKNNQYHVDIEKLSEKLLENRR